MKIHIPLFAAILLAACAQQPSSAENQSVSDAKHMTMAEAQHQSMAAKEQHAPAATGIEASAAGVVQSVDVAAGKITIAHGAVAALKWPAMTMTFDATAVQLAMVKAGDKIAFKFQLKGGKATITSITPAH